MKWRNLFINATLLLIGLFVGLLWHQQQLNHGVAERLLVLEDLAGSANHESRSEVQFIRASNRIKKSVVGIVAFDDTIPEDSLPINMAKTTGSGVVIDSMGYVLTNNHVIEGAEKVEVHFSSGQRVGATVVGVDHETDIAVLKLHSLSGLVLSPVTVAPEKTIRVGQWVLAVANPYISFIRNADPTITAGVVSALHRNFAGYHDVYYQDMIQTDAAINPGNSGGVLINLMGDVVGINTFVYLGNKSGATGIGFSIPMERAMKVVKEILEHGGRRKVRVGVELQEVEHVPTAQKRLVVMQVEPDGAAQKAGLCAGDILVAVDLRLVQTKADLQGIFLARFPGDSITVVIKRRGEEEELTLVLQESAPTPLH